MGFFKKEPRNGDTKHQAQFRRKLSRVDRRSLLDLTEAHVGELSIAVLIMRQRDGEDSDGALWEAQRLTDELAVLLDELDAQ